MMKNKLPSNKKMDAKILKILDKNLNIVSTGKKTNVIGNRFATSVFLRKYFKALLKKK